MKTVSLFRKLETEKEGAVPKINGLRASASGCFSSLAAYAGLDETSYSCGAEWIKNEENRLHIVQRYDADGGASVVLKHAFSPTDPTVFSQGVTFLDLCRRVNDHGPLLCKAGSGAPVNRHAQ